MVLLPLFRHPGNLQAGVQKHLKIKRKSKSMDSRLKISGMTREVDASLNFRHDKKRNPRSERDGLESLRGEGKGEGESTIRGLTPLRTPKSKSSPFYYQKLLWCHYSWFHSSAVIFRPMIFSTSLIIIRS